MRHHAGILRLGEALQRVEFRALQDCAPVTACLAQGLSEVEPHVVGVRHCVEQPLELVADVQELSSRTVHRERKELMHAPKLLFPVGKLGERLVEFASCLSRTVRLVEQPRHHARAPPLSSPGTHRLEALGAERCRRVRGQLHEQVLVLRVEVRCARSHQQALQLRHLASGRLVEVRDLEVQLQPRHMVCSRSTNPEEPGALLCGVATCAVHIRCRAIQVPNHDRVEFITVVIQHTD